MVDTTLMNVEQVSKKVARAVRARDIALKSGDKVSRADGTTTGLVPWGKLDVFGRIVLVDS